MARSVGSAYELDELIGHGASGEVWRGHDRDGRVLAFKLLHESLGRDAAVVRQFVQERQILTSIQHPNLTTVHDLVVEGDTLAIVMEYVDGGDLRRLLDTSEMLRPAEICRIGAAVAGGLQAIHAAGVVHRDVKPENILMHEVAGQLWPKLSDFGIAKLTEQSQTGRSTMLVGTPQYVAPEIFDGQPATPAADLYALGIMLYEMCCGVPPYTGPSALAILRQHAENAPGRPDGLPDELWSVITSLVDRNPESRLDEAGRCETILQALAADLIDFPPAPRITVPPAPRPLTTAGLTEVVARPAKDQTASLPSAPAPEAAAVERSRRRKRRIIPIAIAVAVILTGGAASGYAVLRGNDGGAAPQATVSTTGTTRSSASASSGPVSGSQPSADASSGSSGATTASAEASQPAAAPTDTPATSASGVMPNVVGMTEDGARAELVGVTITTTTQTAPDGTPGGIVLDQDPAAGSDITGSVTLTVSDSDVTSYLSDLPQVSGEVDTDADSELNGKHQLHALGSDTEYGDGDVSFNLGRHYTKLTANVGLDDSSEADKAAVTVEVFGDSQKLSQMSVKFGQPKKLKVDVTGVLRLRIRWSRTDNDVDDVGDLRAAYLVIGDATLTAAPGYIPPDTSDDGEG